MILGIYLGIKNWRGFFPSIEDGFLVKFVAFTTICCWKNKKGEQKNNVTKGKMTFSFQAISRIPFYAFFSLTKWAFEWINRKKCLKIFSLFLCYFYGHLAIFSEPLTPLLSLVMLLLLLLLLSKRKKNKSHWRGVKKRVMEILWPKKKKHNNKCESSFTTYCSSSSSFSSSFSWLFYRKPKYPSRVSDMWEWVHGGRKLFIYKIFKIHGCYE